MGEIREKIADLRRDMESIAQKAGRSAKEIQLVLVTKTVPVAVIREAYDAGCRHFGENRVQELLDKENKLPADIRWHFIGHLQTNKVKYLLGDFVQKHGVPPLIHSLDRPELAAEIQTQAARHKIAEVACLVQVNISGEISKYGFSPDQAAGFIKTFCPDSVLKFKGLMAIGPLTDNKEKIRQAFRSLVQLEQQLKREFGQWEWGILSMGMSGDYEIAIEEGANMLRIGSRVFGERLRT